MNDIVIICLLVALYCKFLLQISSQSTFTSMPHSSKEEIPYSYLYQQYIFMALIWDTINPA